MVQTTSPRKPRQRNPLPAVSGSVRVLQPIGTVGGPENRTGEIEINGKPCLVRVTDTGYQLFGFDAKRQQTTHYDLPLDCSSCDCPDFISRHDLRADHCCKHMKALSALLKAGKLLAASEDESEDGLPEMPAWEPESESLNASELPDWPSEAEKEAA
jgi:hypothetical protein